MITHFYSDPHFGHRQIIGHAERPFASLDDMHSTFVDRYNEQVDGECVVVWVGDAFFMGWEAAREILDAMNGFKILVIGNHDGSKTKCGRIGFDAIVDEMEMRIGDRHVIVSHYPYAGSMRRHGDVDTRYPERRPRRVKGQVLIHGHTHTTKRRIGNMIHVGVDAWDYRPASMAEVAPLVAEV